MPGVEGASAADSRGVTVDGCGGGGGGGVDGKLFLFCSYRPEERWYADGG